MMRRPGVGGGSVCCAFRMSGRRAAAPAAVRLERNSRLPNCVLMTAHNRTHRTPGQVRIRCYRSRMQTVATTLCILLLSCSVAAGQTRQSQSDLGGTLTWLNLGSFDDTATGFGGRLDYHLVDLLWLDAEANVFPANDRVTGRKLEAIAGGKIGGRSRVFGLFGKVRPGAVRFGNDFVAPGTVCIAIV